MIGTNSESGDFNTAVDSVTNKGNFAFSCNRAIRESYNGPLMITDGGVDVTVDNLYEHIGSRISVLCDQTVKHGEPPIHAISENPPRLDVITYGTPLGTEPLYLSFTGSEYFSLVSDLSSDIGVSVTCDPEGVGRQPIFFGNSGEEELCLDLGSAYVRFADYLRAEKQRLFGSINSPDQRKSTYIGNFSDDISVQSANGLLSKGKKKHNFSTGNFEWRIGSDSVNYFSGKLYEMFICDFVIPEDSVVQILSDPYYN